MLVMVVMSGSVDLSLMSNLNRGFGNTATFRKFFGAFLSMALVEGLVWMLWMVGYTMRHRSSSKPLYENQSLYPARYPRPAIITDAGMVIIPAPLPKVAIIETWSFGAMSILFGVCAAPVSSSYGILLVYSWDTMMSMCDGATCPLLVPGFESYDLVRMKLLVQGCLRVFPALVTAAATVAATACPMSCYKTTACVYDDSLIKRYGLTDCSTNAFAPTCLESSSCFVDSRLGSAANASLALASLSFATLIIYTAYIGRKWCCMCTLCDEKPEVDPWPNRPRV